MEYRYGSQTVFQIEYHEAIDVELDEAKLKKSYVPKLSKILPGVKVARYLQIENKIRAIIRYDLASAIPLAY